MIIIGELINGTRDEVREAIMRRDEGAIADLALRQSEAGADYLDCNVGMAGEREPEQMQWLVGVVQSVVDTPVSIDTTNPEAMRAGLDAWQGEQPPICNSLTLERERLDRFLPILRGRSLKVIALAMDDEGVPGGVDARVECALRLIDLLAEEGVVGGSVLVDPVLTPLSVVPEGAGVVCDAIRQIKAERPNCLTVAGISNVSYGLPRRALLNRVFLAQAIGSGLDGAILDPLDRGMMSTLYAAEALAGRDEWCAGYLRAYRHGVL